MCEFDEFLFTCGHSVVRLKQYCHDARNDYPQHYCTRVKVLRNTWIQSRPCESCMCQENRSDSATGR